MDCEAKSSTESMYVFVLEDVRKAAKLAVYVEIKMTMANHQKTPVKRPENMHKVNMFVLQSNKILCIKKNVPCQGKSLQF